MRIFSNFHVRGEGLGLSYEKFFSQALISTVTEFKDLDTKHYFKMDKVYIFTSYAHEDEELKNEMDKYLKVLKRSGKIDTWNDRALIAGQEWDKEIMEELAKANIILLLISVDFNASDFIWEKELKEAMRRHEEGSVSVVPIILRNCKWTDMPYAKLQALPRNAQPVTEYDDRDEAFTFIATELEKLIDKILAK